jgi:hypothetical protein
LTTEILDECERRGRKKKRVQGMKEEERTGTQTKTTIQSKSVISNRGMDDHIFSSTFFPPFIPLPSLHLPSPSLSALLLPSSLFLFSLLLLCHFFCFPSFKQTTTKQNTKKAPQSSLIINKQQTENKKIKMFLFLFSSY